MFVASTEHKSTTPQAQRATAPRTPRLSSYSLSRCRGRLRRPPAQLRIGELALGQLNPQDRGDTTARILGEDYSNQFAMIVYPEATGYEASNFYLQEITTLIDRAVFKTKIGDVTTARTGMFAGCSSGSVAANV